MSTTSSIASIKNNILKITNPDLGNPVAFLATTVSATGTTLTVDNNSQLTQHDFLVIGTPGAPTTEVKRITAAVTAGTALIVAACTFDHPVNTPLYILPNDQVRITTVTTETGSFSTLTTLTWQFDEPYTRYHDTTGAATQWYKVLQYNSYTTTEDTSTLSAAVQNEGFTNKSLRRLKDAGLRRAKMTAGDVGDDYLTELANDCQREVQETTKHWSFAKKQDSSNTLTAGVAQYAIPSDLQEESRNAIIIMKIGNEQPLDWVEWDEYVRRTVGQPKSPLNGAILASATTIDLVDAIDFGSTGSGYIEGDSFSWTGKTSNQLTGVTGVTSGHASGVIAYDARSLSKPSTYTIFNGYIWLDPACDSTNASRVVYIDYYRTIPELVEDADETIIPDASIFKYYIAYRLKEDTGGNGDKDLLLFQAKVREMAVRLRPITAPAFSPSWGRNARVRNFDGSTTEQ
jgi:hypothetical protein